MVAFDDQGVEVGCLGGVHGLKSEVIDYDQLGPDQLAHFGVVAGVEAGSL